MPDTLASATGSSSPPGVAPLASSYLSSGDDSSGVLAKMQKSDDQLAGAVKEGAASRKQQYDAILAERPPEPEAFGINGKSPYEKPPEYKSDDPIKNFGGLATVIGIFGGMLTRRPLVTSLNAASGAMKAYHERNIEDYKTAVDEWKQGVDYTTKLMNWRLSAYDAATSQYKSDVAGHMAAITAIAANTQDQVTLQKAQSGDLHATLEHIDKQKDVMLKYEDNVLRMKDLAQRQAENLTVPKLQAEAVQSRMVAAKLPDGPEKQKVLEHANQIESAIKQSTGDTKLAGTPRSGQTIAVQKYIEDNKDAHDGKGPTGADIQKFIASGSAQNAAQRSLSSGPMGLQLKSLGVATDHLTTLRDLNDAFAGGDVKAIAAAKAKWENEFGTPAPSNIDLAAQFVAPELIKAIEGTPGGVAERDEMATAFKAAQGHANVSGAIDTAFALMGGQMNGMKNQIVKVNKMMSSDEFDDMIPSTALDAMQKHQTKSFQPGGATPTIKTDDEYNALPSGATFIAPDGSTRKKP